MFNKNRDAVLHAGHMFCGKAGRVKGSRYVDNGTCVLSLWQVPPRVCNEVSRRAPSPSAACRAPALASWNCYSYSNVRLELNNNNKDLIRLRCLPKQHGSNQALRVHRCVCGTGLF